jgi:hypothetical protein
VLRPENAREITGGVYVLRCPVSGLVRYVGQASDLKARKHRHITKGHGELLIPWCGYLKAQGLTPVFEVIYRTDDPEAKDKIEAVYIARFSGTLLNVMSEKRGPIREQVADLVPLWFCSGYGPDNAKKAFESRLYYARTEVEKERLSRIWEVQKNWPPRTSYRDVGSVVLYAAGL